MKRIATNHLGNATVDGMQIHVGRYSDLTVHHPAGTDLAAAHAAAKALPNVVIRETFRQVGGGVSSLGYVRAAS